MWKVILLLWLIPAAAGLVISIRLARGMPPLAEHERVYFFGAGAEPSLSWWFGVKLALLAIVLFSVGLVHGLVVININSLWVMLAPLITTLTVMLILKWWLRSISVANSISQRHAPRSLPGMVSQWLRRLSS